MWYMYNTVVTIKLNMNVNKLTQNEIYGHPLMQYTQQNTKKFFWIHYYKVKKKIQNKH